MCVLTVASRDLPSDGSIKGEKPDLMSEDSFSGSEDKSREPSSSTPLSKLDGVSSGKWSRSDYLITLI